MQLKAENAKDTAINDMTLCGSVGKSNKKVDGEFPVQFSRYSLKVEQKENQTDNKIYRPAESTKPLLLN